VRCYRAEQACEGVAVLGMLVMLGSFGEMLPCCVGFFRNWCIYEWLLL